MKFKKGLLFMVAALLLAAALGACSQQQAGAAQQPDWSIAVAGAEKTEFTSADYAKLSAVTIEATLKKKDGSAQEQTWEGVLMKDVVAALGVTEYTSITLEASDGYAKDYTPDIVSDAKTILGTILNGEALGKDGGYVEAVAANQPGNMWIRDLIKITVNK